MNDLLCGKCNKYHSPSMPCEVGAEVPDTSAQDEFLARRHADKTDADEFRINCWEFPNVGWRIQITPLIPSTPGSLTLNLPGAAALWKKLGDHLRERGVIL